MTEEAKVAAKWWADQLRQPTGFDLAELNNPIASMLLDVGRRDSASKLSPEKIDAFEKVIMDWIDQELTEGKKYITLSVDYHPDANLWALMNKADVEDDWIMPSKTTMWIKPGEVSVRNGYGADIKVLYPI